MRECARARGLPLPVVIHERFGECAAVGRWEPAPPARHKERKVESAAAACEVRRHPHESESLRLTWSHFGPALISKN